MTMVRVFFVEDSIAMSHGLIQILSRTPNVTVVGHAHCLHGVIDTVTALRPDVVLLDIRLPDGLGFDVVPALQKINPAPRIYMVTSHADEPYRERAQQIGVNGLFDKANQLDALCVTLSKLGNQTEPLAGA